MRETGIVRISLAALSSILFLLYFSIQGSTQGLAGEHEIHISEATCTQNEGSVHNIRGSLELRVSSVEDGCRVSIINTAEGPKNLLVPFIRSFLAIDRATVGDEASWSHDFGETPRWFSFVTSSKDLDTIQTALEAALKFEDLPYEEAEKIARLYSELAGTIEMHSRHADIKGPKLDKQVFDIELKMPMPQQNTIMPGRINSIRDIELSEGLVARMLNLTPETCMSQHVLDIRELAFHDFDGDGEDEAVVYGFSCWGGTGGPDVFIVLTAKEGTVREVPFLRPGNEEHPNYYRGLRGKLQFEIEGNSLVEIYPIYNKDDANCCPTGGTREFYYTVKNGEFTLDKVIDLPK